MGDAGAAFDADGNACSRTGATAGIGESTPSYRIIFNDMKCKLRGYVNSLILLRILLFFFGHDAHRNPIRITQITFVPDSDALEYRFDQTDTPRGLRLANSTPSIDPEVMVVSVSGKETRAIAVFLHQPHSERRRIELLTLFE